MSHFLEWTARAERTSGPPSAPMCRWPEVLVLLAVGAMWSVFCGMPVSHDVVWQMWIARQMLRGAKLYRDIVEVNPPLWYWLAMPAQFWASRLGWSANAAIVSITFVYMAVALTLTGKLLDPMPAPRRAMVLASAFLAVAVVPLAAFEQREHLALIGTIPYLTLVTRRADGRSTSTVLAIVVALVAAPAFALKHYFVLVPALLEIWLMARRRRTSTPLRPEVITLFAAATAYAVAVVLITPTFFSTIVPLLVLAYSGMKAPFSALLGNPMIPMWLLSVVLLSWFHRKAEPLPTAAGIAACAFAMSYFIQQKGWWYHSVPVSGALVFALGSLVASPAKGRIDRVRTTAAAITMAIPLAFAVWIGPYHNANATVVDALLSDTEPGQSVLVLTAHPSHAWPMIDERGYIWPSRYYAFWMVDAINRQIKEKGGLSPDMKALADLIRRQTVVDVDCHPPQLILVDDFRHSLAANFDILRFFGENAGFAAIFQHYRRLETKGDFTSYAKDPDWGPPKPSKGCRPIS